MWYIIGGIIALLLVGWFLTRGTTSLIGAPAGVGTDRNADGSTTYTNSEGTVTVGGNKMPDNWPSDAPAAYSGASIVYSGTSDPQTGKAGSAVSYTVNAPIASVVDYYKTQLASNGWTVEATANVGGATVISATKNARTMGVYVVDSGSGTTAVTAGIEM
jgi:hypothetical protein